MLFNDFKGKEMPQGGRDKQRSQAAPSIIGQTDRAYTCTTQNDFPVVSPQIQGASPKLEKPNNLSN